MDDIVAILDDGESIDDYPPSSGHMITWKCAHGHTWRKSIAEQRRYPQCPYCLLLKRNNITIGRNDLMTTHPRIAAMWDDRHNRFPPQYYTAQSRAKVFWKRCKQRVSIDDYVRKHNALMVDGNVAALYPQYVSWFDEASDYTPYEITPKSERMVALHCTHGHHWKEKVRYFIKRNGTCPVCRHLIIQTGINDLATEDPKLADELVSPDPHTVMKNSSAMGIWTCHTCHGIWKTRISARALYHRGCVYCNGHEVLRGYNDLLTAVPEVKGYWSTKNAMQPDEVAAAGNSLCILQCQENPLHTWTAPAYYISRKNRTAAALTCSICHPHGISTGEREIGDLLSKKVDIIRSDRSILHPQELDILIPSRHMAIEYNGLYYHSENMGCDRYYHYNKWKQCKDRGIQLIGIWEDEWLQRPDIVMSMLYNKLHCADGRRIGARKLSIHIVDSDDARVFLNAYHIQGYDRGSSYIGLYDDRELVAVLSVRRYSYSHHAAILVNRYATKIGIAGGFSKLLAYAIPLFPSARYVVSFSDHCVSNGNMYARCGFVKDEEIPPDYKYVVGDKRIHKYNYRIKRFREDASLIYEQGKTERELADMNGLSRIWDAGKDRWIKEI